jgi:hypothetical protein
MVMAASLKGATVWKEVGQGVLPGVSGRAQIPLARYLLCARTLDSLEVDPTDVTGA